VLADREQRVIKLTEGLKTHEAAALAATTQRNKMQEVFTDLEEQFRNVVKD
jgi:hypothetical protein